MMAISTRHHQLNRLFGGLDSAYVVHKWLGVAPGNVWVHLVDSRHERLTVDTILSTVAWTCPGDVFYCGPQPLRRSLTRGLRAARLPLAAFHFENFAFGR